MGIGVGVRLGIGVRKGIGVGVGVGVLYRLLSKAKAKRSKFFPNFKIKKNLTKIQ